MERKMLVAIMLSFAVILIYTRFIMPTPAKKVTERAADQREVREVITPKPVEKKAEKQEIVKVVKEAGGKLSTVNTQVMDVDFSEAGGTIHRLVLKKSTVIKKGPVEIVRPLGASYAPLSISADSPVKITPDARYEIVQEDLSRGIISFKREFGPLKVTKRYSVPDEGFVISMELELENTGAEQLSLEYGLGLSAGTIFALKKKGRANYLGIDRLTDKGKVARLAWRKLKAEKVELTPTRWIAAKNQYFTIVAKPDQTASGFWAVRLRSEDDYDGVRAGIRFAPVSLKPGERRKIGLQIYIGPKEYTALNAFGAVEVIDLGIFGFLGKWILKGLVILYGLCGNYGVAIILITIVIRVILYPLNQKSFRSMKAMQKLQPKITEIQAKYKNDPKKKQQEMMKIYREQGINPMGGCFPLLLQMPILIAFFRVLQNSIELWGAPFALWINDLSEPDALMTIATGTSTIPIIGRIVGGQPCVSLNVLPILLLIVFFVQQRMTSPAMAATPEQAQQQKMMSYLMPVMFGVIFYNFPAGLNLYFAASTLLGIVQQKYMIR